MYSKNVQSNGVRWLFARQLLTARIVLVPTKTNTNKAINVKKAARPFNLQYCMFKIY